MKKLKTIEFEDLQNSACPYDCSNSYYTLMDLPLDTFYEIIT